MRMASDAAWTSFFFVEDNIVNTFQNLLLHGTQTVDDLYKLCLAVHESTLVLAFTLDGLSPFAMHTRRDDEPRPVWTSLPITHQ
jgi:hypothetical protein